MTFFGFIHMTAGGTMSLILLLAIHGEWQDFGMLVLLASVPNGITGLIASLLFRAPWSVAGSQQAFVGLCYLIGFGGGVYFYYT